MVEQILQILKGQGVSTAGGLLIPEDRLEDVAALIATQSLNHLEEDLFSEDEGEPRDSDGNFLECLAQLMSYEETRDFLSLKRRAPTEREIMDVLQYEAMSYLNTMLVTGGHCDAQFVDIYVQRHRQTLDEMAWVYEFSDTGLVIFVRPFISIYDRQEGRGNLLECNINRYRLRDGEVEIVVNNIYFPV
jgi:hypothetical protein